MSNASAWALHMVMDVSLLGTSSLFFSSPPRIARVTHAGTHMRLLDLPTDLLAKIGAHCVETHNGVLVVPCKDTRVGIHCAFDSVEMHDRFVRHVQRAFGGVERAKAFALPPYRGTMYVPLPHTMGSVMAVLRRELRVCNELVRKQDGWVSFGIRVWDAVLRRVCRDLRQRLAPS